jgi:Flp pilus assembly protein TadD
MNPLNDTTTQRLAIQISALLANEKYQQALDTANHALAMHPQSAALCDLAGVCASRLGYVTQAEQHHRNALLRDRTATAIRLNLANLLAGSSRNEDREEAKALFLEIIQAEPSHLQALNDLGILLFQTGYVSAAHTVYAALVAHHPDEVTAHVNFGHVLLYLDNLPLAQTHFHVALSFNPDLPEAHQGLASVFHRLHDEDKASFHRKRGFSVQPVSRLPYSGQTKPVPLLILASAQEGNIPWRFLIDSNVFETTIIAVEYFDNATPLPAHALVFNAIGDADLCHDGLKMAQHLLESSHAPIINQPAAVLKTGRMANAMHRQTVPGVIFPRMVLFSKLDTETLPVPEVLAQAHIHFPFLLRTPGFHGGNYFLSVENRHALHAAMAALPGENLLAIEFLDSQSKDGLFRKYRVMSIHGRLYPIHMAISTQWKVHYFSSDMANSPAYRHEESLFLNYFSTYLGPGALTSLQQISQSIGLDFCGMDFGFDANGNILLYEANATMAINPPSADAQWDYKRKAIENALTATKKMFLERATVSVFRPIGL